LYETQIEEFEENITTTKYGRGESNLPEEIQRGVFQSFLTLFSG